MRSLLVIFLVACTAARPFVPERVYVVAPCVREKHEEMASGTSILSIANGIEPHSHPADHGDVILCESRNQMPLVDCGQGGTMRYDGCRWACRPWFDLYEQEPAHITFQVNGYRVEGQE